MKRRDFLKLPVLIPGVKKLLDDFTLPEETPVSDYIETSLNAKDKSDRQYDPPAAALSQGFLSKWVSNVFGEDDIENGYIDFLNINHGLPFSVCIRDETPLVARYLPNIQCSIHPEYVDCIRVYIPNEIKRGIIFRQVI